MSLKIYKVENDYGLDVEIWDFGSEFIPVIDGVSYDAGCETLDEAIDAVDDELYWLNQELDARQA